MNLTGVPAYGAQLAELLAGVMKLAGHLPTPPKDFQEVMEAARGVIAAGARIETPTVLDASRTDGHAQRVWIVKDAAGTDVMLCPQEPNQHAISQIEGRIGREVKVEEYFLTPTSLAALVDKGFMSPLPAHGGPLYLFNFNGANGHRVKGYTAEQVRQAQAEAAALDRHMHPRATDAPAPVFVVEMDGGTILKTSGTQAGQVIFIDSDTEGGDADQVMRVLDADHYVIQHVAHTGPDGVALVHQVLTDITDAEEASEAAQPLPRYVVGPHWKDFLDGMEDEQTMRMVYDTETKRIIAMEIETDGGYVPASTAAIAEALDSLVSEPEPLAEPFAYGLEYVDEVPAWAAPGALALPSPVHFALPNYEGPDHFSLDHLQEHAIEYVIADRAAAGREHAAPPSIDDLPLPPAPAFPGIPDRGVEHHFSTEQMFGYRQLAAEMDRQAYALAETGTEDEDTEAPRA